MLAQEFDAIVEQALRRIPSRFRRRLHNVAIMVEREPSTGQLSAGRVPRGDTLLGLYEGRPLPVRSVSEGFGLPDRITLFQGPIERLARSYADLERIVYETLWHEIAHYFGMDERQVRDAERRRRQAQLRRERRARG